MVGGHKRTMGRWAISVSERGRQVRKVKAEDPARKPCLGALSDERSTIVIGSEYESYEWGVLASSRSWVSSGLKDAFGIQEEC